MVYRLGPQALDPLASSWKNWETNAVSFVLARYCAQAPMVFQTPSQYQFAPISLKLVCSEIRAVSSRLRASWKSPVSNLAVSSPGTSWLRIQL